MSQLRMTNTTEIRRHPHGPPLHYRITNITSGLAAIWDRSLADINTTKWVSVIRPREEARSFDTRIQRKCDHTLSENK